MKILLVGAWQFEIYEQALGQGLSELGHEVVPFKWGNLLDGSRGWRSVACTLQRRVRQGPLIAAINQALVESTLQERPDAVFVFRGDIVFPRSFQQIRDAAPQTVLAVYNNDDPFSPFHPKHRFRHFVASLPIVDLAFAYRPANLREFLQAGASKVCLLPPWYVPGVDRPYNLTVEEEKFYSCDAVFIGHFEPDGRLDALGALADAGVNVRVFGTEWPSKGFPTSLSSSFPVRPLRGHEYRKALSASKIALVFLSRLNRDCYTRRNFEIPAVGTFMLSEYTDELAELFVPGVHADYFSSRNELVEKTIDYSANDQQREKIARAGLMHVRDAGYDVVSRAAIVAGALSKASLALKDRKPSA